MPKKKKKNHSLFIASTKQHLGKTTLCLGLFALLQKYYRLPTYMKPIGQEQVALPDGSFVDKDARLFKESFNLVAPYPAMSPLLIPHGFTRNFLDRKIKESTLSHTLKKAHQTLSSSHDFILMEGTGHCGVGSIFNFNNAQVASLFKGKMLLLSSGGLGSAFDELALNKALCDHYQVPILGIIINKIQVNKFEMVQSYMKKALKRWKIPLLGAIPEDPILSRPSMRDFELLFKTTLLSGKDHLMRHFNMVKLLNFPLKEPLAINDLLIAPSHREDLLEMLLANYWTEKTKNPSRELPLGVILSGEKPPRHSLVDHFIDADIPMLYTPLHSEHVIEMIHSTTVKIQVKDREKVKEAIDLVASHVDFDTILERL